MKESLNTNLEKNLQKEFISLKIGYGVGRFYE